MFESLRFVVCVGTCFLVLANISSHGQFDDIDSFVDNDFDDFDDFDDLRARDRFRFNEREPEGPSAWQRREMLNELTFLENRLNHLKAESLNQAQVLEAMLDFSKILGDALSDREIPYRNEEIAELRALTELFNSSDSPQDEDLFAFNDLINTLSDLEREVLGDPNVNAARMSAEKKRLNYMIDSNHEALNWIEERDSLRKTLQQFDDW